MIRATHSEADGKAGAMFSTDYRAVVIRDTAERHGLGRDDVETVAQLVERAEFVRAEGFLASLFAGLGACEPFADAHSMVNGLMGDLS